MRYNKQYTPRFITDEELKKIFDSAINKKFLLYLHCLYYLQLRSAEALNIQKKHINFEESMITIPVQKNSRLHAEIYPIPPQLLKELALYITYNESTIDKRGGYLFNSRISKSKMSINTIKQLWMNTLNNSGLNTTNIIYGTDKRGYKRRRLSLHTLKAAGIQKTYNKTKDLVQTQALAHHQAHASTLRYIGDPTKNIQLKKEAIAKVWID